MPGTNLNNLDAYNEIEVALGGVGGHLNDLDAANSIAVLEGTTGGRLFTLDALNAIDLDAGGVGTHENTLDALNSIVVLKGGVGGHENDLDALNEWVDFASVALPLDAVTGAEAAYSIARRLTTTSWGTVDSVLDPLVRLREDGGDTEETFTYDANGDLDTAAIVTFLAGANGFVTKLYDQTGNGHDVVQTTAANQPAYTVSGIGGKPTMTYDNVNDFMDLVTPTSETGEFHTYVIVNLNSLSFECLIAAVDDARRFFTVATSTAYDFFPDGSATIDLTVTLTTATDFLLGLSRDGSNNLSGYVDGTDRTSGTPSQADVVGLGGFGARKGGASNFLNGEMSEVLYYQTEHSAADQTLLNDDLKAYYGI